MSELFIAGTQPSASRPQPVAAGPVIADPPDGAQFALSSAIPVAAQRIAVSISSPKPEVSSQKHGERYELLVDGRPAGGCTPASSPVPQNWGTGPQEQICTVLWTLRPGRHPLAAVVEACDCAETPRQWGGGRRLRAIWITVVKADG